ncbi:GNAT family N-acetyltransferase [Pseudomonas nitroreducens]|uniref:GNAT family N-acetyltransferase n=1 Tax=Pseudomonas nitroreducens TaxID=46680 RepID=A0ABS0KIB9_PSENT|nr:arsenic resistance N-acetyltransferase ArsN2 [Pseudomonas nitroreducens]MBG6287818.1 GNAT family N-acetyltransferase [Pseudomonas nitroreducens]
MANSLQLLIVSSADLPLLVQALLEADLPGDDVALPGKVFYAFQLEGQHIGYAGLEVYGPDALLRSVLIDPLHRKRELGSLVVSEVEKLAREAGIETLHLLTTNQTAFFERIGYVLTPRQVAPPDIAGTAQFKTLCPSSANYLRKNLGTMPLDGHR